MPCLSCRTKKILFEQDLRSIDHPRAPSEVGVVPNLLSQLICYEQVAIDCARTVRVFCRNVTAQAHLNSPDRNSSVPVTLCARGPCGPATAAFMASARKAHQ